MIQRMKRGPKTDPLTGELAPLSILVDDLTRERLRVVGGGNLSRGVREAARIAYDRYQATPDSPKWTGATPEGWPRP